ncbi:MAG TPA: SAM-dependent methyltransferase [Acholeplasmataceae bacterium]|jgi:tRNA (adenine22-N1)-methyltransferase|nr:SAM-dependent methyltransferase [Acholeplasmataceae bacterium]
MFGKRIEKLASLIKDSKKIADIGTDHGYLVIEALLEGKTLKAQAIDNKKMPLLRAKENIANFGLEEKVSFSLSNGLDDLEKDVDYIIMSGLGGSLIISLLEENLNKINKQTLILQANRNCAELRSFLSENSFKIEYEEVIFDDKYYEIIVTKKIDEKIKLTDKEVLFGPYNLKHPNNVFYNYLEDEYARYEKIKYPSKQVIHKKSLIKEILTKRK